MNLLVEIIFASCLAIIGGVFIVALWMGFCTLLNHYSLSAAERLAIAQFKQDYPQERFSYSMRIETENSQIVAICYGETKPRYRKHYVVNLEKQMAVEIQDDAQYRPILNR